METQWDILGVGSAAVDDLLFVDRFPIPDEKMPVRAKQRRCGGQTSTALVAAARQGAKTAYFSSFGEDGLSQTLRVSLEKEGVDCSQAVLDLSSQAIHSIVIVEAPTGRRTILFHTSGFREPVAEMVTADLITRSRMLFVDQNVPIAGFRAAQIAHEHQIPVLADLDYKNHDQASQILPYIDHLIVGLDFATQMTGKRNYAQMVSALANPKRMLTAITCGSEGCWYSIMGEAPLHQPAYRVVAVDTTGCGDVFHGVYAAAIVRGEAVPHAIRLASAAAAIKATRSNGWAGIPTMSEVEASISGSEI